MKRLYLHFNTSGREDGGTRPSVEMRAQCDRQAAAASHCKMGCVNSSLARVMAGLGLRCAPQHAVCARILGFFSGEEND